MPLNDADADALHVLAADWVRVRLGVKEAVMVAEEVGGLLNGSDGQVSVGLQEAVNANDALLLQLTVMLRVGVGLPLMVGLRLRDAEAVRL